MFVQSNSGKVYAILADNEHYEIGILPGLRLISTSVVLYLRCRYRNRSGEPFDPMLAPKRVLAGGVERSEDTLRSTCIYNTGWTIEQVGKSFSPLMADKIQTAALSHFLMYDTNEAQPPANFINVMDVRDDFREDFGKLITQTISAIYPVKDLSGIPEFTTEFDFGVAVQYVDDKQTNLTAVPDAATDNVQKVDFIQPTIGKVDKPEPAGV